MFPKIELKKLRTFPYMLINIIQKNLLNVFDKLRYLGLKPKVKFCFDRNELASFAEDD